MSRTAANIADLTRYDAIPSQCLIAPVIQTRRMFLVETDFASERETP